MSSLENAQFLTKAKGFLTHSAHFICFLVPKVDLLSEFDGIIEATY
jgi:hypothetical protein